MKATDYQCWYRDFPQSPYAENLRTLRAALLHLKKSTKSKFLIASSWPGDGKTTICSNLGLSLAELGHRVLLADFNHLNQKLTSLTRSSAPADPSQPQPGSTAGVYLLSLATELTQNGAAYDLMNQGCRSRLGGVFASYDFVLVDTAALSVSREAFRLAGLVDGALMVVSNRRFKGVAEGNHSEDLRDFGIDVLGLVASG